MSLKSRVPWQTSAVRAELLDVYAKADALFDGWACSDCSPGIADPSRPVPSGSAGHAPCCHFGVVEREPYPTAVELHEVRHAMANRGIHLASGTLSGGRRRRLPIAEGRPCPLLSDEGRCRIYASRPFGCRTFFCDTAEAPFGARAKLPRADLRALGGRIAALSARFAPHDHRPRPLTRALLCGHGKVGT
jgi:hypothetical protein